jgi:23S rRNA pseudouridine1911/1915/1917 synthase
MQSANDDTAHNSVSVIYEDDDVIAVNKPAGIAVHEDGHTTGPFLTDWVREHRPELVGVGETMRLQNGTVIDRPGVVHRIDRDTSGVLVLAKTQEAFMRLKEQFQGRGVEKVYHAVVWGEMTQASGTVDRPIGRSRKDFRLWTSGPTAGGTMRAATTRWHALAVGNGFSYLAVEPKTGRTHQIRVHMKDIGHPVVCDMRYGVKKGCALGFTRLALHAHALSFTHPNGARITFEAPIPVEFERARLDITKR